MKSLSQLLTTLTEANIDFVIVGGFAGVLHGSSLVTRDLDLCTILSRENVERLRNALKELNPKHRMTPGKLSFLDFPETTARLNKLYLETDLGAVDILSDIKGVGDFETLASNAVTIDILGSPVKVISLDDLITAKEAMAREKDLLAAKELKAIKAKLEE